jgi:hypothetical protein
VQKGLAANSEQGAIALAAGAIVLIQPERVLPISEPGPRVLFGSRGAGTGPSYRADTLPPKRLRRVKLFGNGELNRLIADALRRAEKPLASHDIADAICEAKGYGRESIHALTRRVRANLSYLLRHQRVVKTGDRLTARWALPAEAKEAAY